MVEIGFATALRHPCRPIGASSRGAAGSPPHHLGILALRCALNLFMPARRPREFGYFAVEDCTRIAVQPLFRQAATPANLAAIRAGHDVDVDGRLPDHRLEYRLHLSANGESWLHIGRPGTSAGFYLEFQNISRPVRRNGRFVRPNLLHRVIEPLRTAGTRCFIRGLDNRRYADLFVTPEGTVGCRRDLNLTYRSRQVGKRKRREQRRLELIRIAMPLASEQYVTDFARSHPAWWPEEQHRLRPKGLRRKVWAKLVDELRSRPALPVPARARAAAAQPAPTVPTVLARAPTSPPAPPSAPAAAPQSLPRALTADSPAAKPHHGTDPLDEIRQIFPDVLKYRL